MSPLSPKPAVTARPPEPQAQGPDPAPAPLSREESLRNAVLGYFNRPGLPGELMPLAEHIKRTVADNPGRPLEVAIVPGNSWTGFSNTEETITCKPPNPEQWNAWRLACDTMNRQFAEAGIPLRYSVDDGSMPSTSADATLPVASCENVQRWDGHQVNWSTRTVLDYFLFHETGHSLGLSHNYGEAYGNEDLRHFVCDVPGSVMVPGIEFCGAYHYRVFEVPAQFGKLDLCELQQLTSPESMRTELRERCADDIVKLLFDKGLGLGPKLAAAFASNACATVIESSLNQIFLRTVSDPQTCANLRLVSKGLAGIAQALILSQMTGGIGLGTAIVAGGAALGTGLGDTLPITKTLRALLNLAGHVNLGSALMQALTGNAGSLVTLAAAFGGRYAGTAVSLVLEKALEMCAPLQDAEKRAGLVDPPLPEADVLANPSLPWGARVQKGYDELHGAVSQSRYLQALVKLDEDIAGIINQYLTLNVFRSYIYASDAAEAAKASDIETNMGEIKIDLGQPEDERPPVKTTDDDDVIRSDSSSAPSTPAKQRIDWGSPLVRTDSE